MPLWVGGLALSIVLLGALAIPLSGEALEWAIYLLLGTLFPALAIVLAVPWQRGRAGDLADGSIQAIAAAVCVVAGFTLVVSQAGATVLGLAGATWALGVLLSRRGAGRSPVPLRPAELLVGLFLVTLSWTDPRPAHRTGIDSLLPRADAALVTLLAKARVGVEEPVAYLGQAGNPLPNRPTGSEPERWTASYRAWLPTTPTALYMPLAESRGRTYVRRFVHRARLGGWLIEWKPLHPRLQLPWLADELQRTHAVTAVYENDAWRLTRFELR
jgi:hypothetical protein